MKSLSYILSEVVKVLTVIIQKKPRCSQIILIHHRAHRFSNIKASAPRINHSRS